MTSLDQSEKLLTEFDAFTRQQPARTFKTIQARILAYAMEIGWTVVTRPEAEQWRGFDSDASTPEERARRAPHHFGDPAFPDFCFHASFGTC